MASTTPDTSTTETGTAAPLPDAPLPVLGHLPSRWEPPQDAEPRVTTHAGEALSPSFLYLAAPPMEIGSVRSAFSSIHIEKGIETQVMRRIGGIIGGIVLGAGIVWVIGAKIGLWFFSDVPMTPLIIGGLIGSVVGFFSSKPKYYTSYVGENGLASFQYGNRRSPIAKAEVFPFERGAVLHTEQTRRYTNGVYNGTTYKYTWKDAANKTIHTISGQHNSKEGTPPATDPYYFALAAEQAWNYYRFPQYLEKLRQGQSVVFPVQGKGAVLISPQGLQLQFGGKNEVISMEEIGNLSINKGQVTITRTGAKKGVMGIGKEGIYTFPYASLGNASLFLAFLSKVIGQEAPKVNEVSTEATASGKPGTEK